VIKRQETHVVLPSFTLFPQQPSTDGGHASIICEVAGIISEKVNEANQDGYKNKSDLRRK
jgi:hypothetical protein